MNLTVMTSRILSRLWTLSPGKTCFTTSSVPSYKERKTQTKGSVAKSNYHNTISYVTIYLSMENYKHCDSLSLQVFIRKSYLTTLFPKKQSAIICKSRKPVFNWNFNMQYVVFTPFLFYILNIWSREFITFCFYLHFKLYPNLKMFFLFIVSMPFIVSTKSD